MMNCFIIGNIAYYNMIFSRGGYGGGIYCKASSPDIMNCLIEANIASSYPHPFFALGGNGGGIYCIDSSPRISDMCIIYGNIADNSGGGIYCSSSSPRISEMCMICGNNANNSGGGLYCRSSSPTIEKCTFGGNFASDNGGGIACSESSSPNITNCVINANSVNHYGSGIYCNYSSPSLINCTFSGNSANNGGGIACVESSSPIVKNCILWEDSPDEIYKDSNSTTEVTYSNIQNGDFGEDNIDDDPLFVDPDPNVWNYRLKPGSPCIDSGTNTGVPLFDCDYTPRPQDGDRIGEAICDMGAFEYSPPLECIVSPGESIQDAILAGYLQIILQPGIYYENIDFTGKAITVTGTDPNNPDVVAATVIDGGQTGSVVKFINREGKESVLKGITLRNGHSENGGGIYCSSSSPSIINCVITGNSSDTNGGGIYCVSGYIPYLSYSSPTIDNCMISRNSATYGGGIYCGNGYAKITNCTISRNTAEKNGGGIYCNSLYFIGAWYSLFSPKIINSIISRNSAQKGGGIYCYASSPKITNCTIIGNFAEETGGGINCTTFFSLTYPLPQQTISSNPTIKNSILWADYPNESSGDLHSFSRITYSDIQGEYSGKGNIEADPLFVNINAEDYHLQSGSLCIDSATETDAPESDKDDNPRPQGFGYDMGAYEAKNLTQPEITVSPAMIDFSDVYVGLSRTRTIVVKNTGTSDLVIYALNLQEMDFSIEFPQTTIESNNSKKIRIIFTPQEVGTRFRTISLQSNAWNSPTTITLKGKGTNNPEFLRLGSDSISIGISALIETESLELRVPVYLDISKDIFSIKFDVSYDSNILTATGINIISPRVTGTLAPDSIDDLNGKVIVSLLDMSNQTVISHGEGEILEITFSPDKGCIGSFPLEIKNVMDVFATDDASLINLSIQNGEISILEQICTADVDMDCELGIFDLVYINREHQEFNRIVPDIWLITNPNIPQDKEIIDNIERCRDFFDVDDSNILNTIDMVLMNRSLGGFTKILPQGWPGPPEDQISEAVEALKPLCAIERAKTIKMRTYSEGISINNHLHIEKSTYVNNGQQEIKVPVYLNTNDDLFSLMFDIEFDPTKLEGVDLIKNPSRIIASPYPDAIDNIRGKIIVNISDMVGGTAMTAGQGKILDVVFYIRPGFTEGSVMLSINNIREVYSTSAVRIDLTSENGNLFITNQMFFEMELPPGWSMISLPVAPSSLPVSSLFPGAVVIYGYKKGFGYQRVTAEENLEIGKGYWILLDMTKTLNIPGEKIEEYNLPVQDGWNMIGGCTSDVEAFVDKGEIKVIYDYVQGIGYQQLFESGPLQPGRGYWINLSEPANLMFKFIN